MMSNDRRDLVLVGPDNTVERIAIPPLPGAARLSEFISEVSPSGRYVVLGAEENSAFGPERSGAGILDIESGRWVWTHPALVNEQVAEREVFAFIRESGDGLKIYFTRYGHDCIPPAVTCANGRLVEIDARTNVVREMPIPAGDFRPNLAEYYGPDRVLLYLVPSQVPSQSLEIPEVALVDLRSMRVVWTGRRDAAPPRSSGVSCTFQYGDANGGFDVSLGGQSFAVSLRNNRAQCAASWDGHHILLLSPDRAYLYAVHHTGRAE